MILASILTFYGIDWFSYYFLCLHLYLIGVKKKSGWVIGGVSSVCQIAISVMIGSIPMFIFSSYFFVMCILNYYKWRKDENRREEEEKTDKTGEEN